MERKEYIRHLLVVETLEGKLSREGLETLGCALTLYGSFEGCAILLAGQGIDSEALTLAKTIGMPVFIYDDERFYYPNGDLLASGIAEIVQELDIASVILVHTITGVHAASRAAALTGFSCVTAVDSLDHENETIIFHRSVQYGKARAAILLHGGSFIVTIAAGSFPVPDVGVRASSAPEVITRKVHGGTSFMPLEIEKAESSRSLDEAEVIVSAGRGIGSEENLSMVRDVVKIFSRAALACSRPLCDLGWLPYAHQVGSTGRTVSPKLYMACGISGASQHLAGMKGSQIIVAINRDPNAAIFSVADYGVVEDLAVFLPLLVEKYHESNDCTK